MKRFVFWSALASVALASCVNDEAMENSNQASEKQQITFQAPVIGGMTRAVNGEIVGTYPKDEKFIVYAAWHENKYSAWSSSTTYMDSVVVANAEYDDTDNDGSTGWTTTGDEIYYWPEGGGYLTFAAYSPSDAKGKFTYDASKGLQITNFVVEAEAANQYDLMYSERTYNQTKDAQTDTNKDYDGVDIKFHHALSSIRFAAKTAEDYSKTTTITLTGVKLYGVASKGDFTEGISEETASETDLTVECKRTPKWTVSTTDAGTIAESNAYVAYSNTNVGLTLNTTAKTLNEKNYVNSTKDTISNNLILLPQTLAEGAVVEVTYTIKTVGNAIPQKAKVAINSKDLIETWEPGKRYTYTIIIGLDKIYFAPIVEEWTDVPAANGEPEKVEI